KSRGCLAVGAVSDRASGLRRCESRAVRDRAYSKAAWILGSLFAIVMGLTLAAQTPKPAPQAAVIEQYCVTCHNARLKTAGLVLEPSELSRVSTKPELWEKVVRKLRSSAMPPAGAPRPDKATYDSVATFLETELDHAAATKPNPGMRPLFHRLSRTEYQNTVRDLLG